MTTMKIEQTEVGWHIETSSGFTADLPLCRYDHKAPGTGRHKPKPVAKGSSSCDAPDGGWHPDNVVVFLEKIAATYGRYDRPEIPMVTFDPDLLDPKILDRLSRLGLVPAKAV